MLQKIVFFPFLLFFFNIYIEHRRIAMWLLRRIVSFDWYVRCFVYFIRWLFALAVSRLLHHSLVSLGLLCFRTHSYNAISYFSAFPFCFSSHSRYFLNDAHYRKEVGSIKEKTNDNTTIKRLSRKPSSLLLGLDVLLVHILAYCVNGGRAKGEKNRVFYNCIYTRTKFSDIEDIKVNDIEHNSKTQTDLYRLLRDSFLIYIKICANTFYNRVYIL